jgi:hypothetical protein
LRAEELEKHIDSVVRELDRELHGQIPHDRVETVNRGHYKSLCRDAAINDFIPVLVYRFAKEELVETVAELDTAA